MAGIYIHIPFCKSRCIYCGFYSTTREDLRDKYVDALCHELELRTDYLPPAESIETIYLGGGTPSLLTAHQLRKLFLYINKVYGNRLNLKEVTIECNPDDVTEAYARQIAQMPVNRISMGVQTFSDTRLAFLHRRHHAMEAMNAVKVLRENGIKNISIDLMFGFPGETEDEWEKDIDQALSLNVEHISAYSLMYEEGTPLDQLLKQGKIREIDDDLSLKMYDTLIDRLTAAGYEHYEISNFALPGYRSIHNSSYWHAIPYIGIGAAAHSYDLASRQWNISNLSTYIASIAEDKIPMEKEMLDERTRYDDLVTTALRTTEGIDLKILGPTDKAYLIENAHPYILRNLMEIKDGHLRITRKGIYISDTIMSDLMHV